MGSVAWGGGGGVGASKVETVGQVAVSWRKGAWPKS